MDIKETLPFENCQQCPNFALDVYMDNLYGDDGILTRRINVSCRNRWLCTQLAEKFGEKNVGRDCKKESV